MQGFLPLDCRGWGPDDPLVRLYRAGPAAPDFAKIFLQAADLIFAGIHGAGGEAARWPFFGGGGAPAWDLYNGLPGIAIVAAAHSVATRRPDGALLADRILAGLLAARPGDTLVFSGAAVGLGSAVYSLLTVGGILGRQDCQERAIELALQGSPGNSARSFDVVGGDAGSILVLDRAIAAASALRPAAVPELRRRLGEAVDRLLASSRKAGEGRAFGAAGTPAESGFAHGASGAAVALARASRRIAIPQLDVVLGEILDFEKSLYLPQAGNWLSSTAETAKRPIGWCRGAPGIAMARLAILAAGVGPRGALLADLELALRATLALPLLPFDHVCCGTLARAETLLFAHEISGAAEDLAAARWIALRVLRAAKARGSLAAGSDRSDDPSFFQGSAGMAYCFLRLALPGSFPSILGFDGSSPL